MKINFLWRHDAIFTLKSVCIFYNDAQKKYLLSYYIAGIKVVVL